MPGSWPPMAASITTPSSSRRSRRIVGRVVAASDRPEQPYRITLLNAPGGQRLCASRRLSLRHPRAARAGQRFLRGRRGARPTRWATSPPTTPSSAQNKARDALLVSRVVTDVLSDDERRQAGACLEPADACELLAPAGARGRRHRREDHRQGRLRPLRGGALPRRDGPLRRPTAAPCRSPRTSGRTSSPRIPRRPSASNSRRAPRASSGRRASARSTATAYLAGIDGMIFGDDPSQGYVRDRSFVHPALGVAFTVPEGFVIDNTSDAVLATGTDGTALRFDAVGARRRRRPRRLSRLGLGQRPDRGQHPDIHGQRPARRLGQAPMPRAGRSRSRWCRRRPGRPTASSSPTR